MILGENGVPAPGEKRYIFHGMKEAKRYFKKKGKHEALSMRGHAASPTSSTNVTGGENLLPRLPRLLILGKGIV